MGGSGGGRYGGGGGCGGWGGAGSGDGVVEVEEFLVEAEWGVNTKG